MKAEPSRDRYFKLSDAKKRKKTVEWCILMLRLDIDNMPLSEFIDFFFTYEYLIAYPETGDYAVFPWSDRGQKALRDTFRNYQTATKRIINDFKKCRSLLKFQTKMALTVKVGGKEEKYYKYYETQHDFEYGYARQIARLLDGKKFTDVFKTCPACDNYFADLYRHGKGSCSHRCAQALSSKNRIDKNQALTRRQGNISSHVSVLKSKGYTDKQIQSSLGAYVKQRNYKPEEIPKSIKKLMGYSPV